MAGAKAGAAALAAPDAFAVMVAVHTSDLGVDVVARVSGTRNQGPSWDSAADVLSVKLETSSVVSARARLPREEVDAAVEYLLQALEDATCVGMRMTVSLGGRLSSQTARSTYAL